MILVKYYLPIISKKLYSKQQNLLLQNHFQRDNFYASPKATLHVCQRSFKIECLCRSFVYSMSDDTISCINSALLLPAEKQRSLGSFVNKEHKSCHIIHQILSLHQGNPFHKDAAKLVFGIIWKYKESHIIPFLTKLMHLNDICKDSRTFN